MNEPLFQSMSKDQFTSIVGYDYTYPMDSYMYGSLCNAALMEGWFLVAVLEDVVVVVPAEKMTNQL